MKLRQLRVLLLLFGFSILPNLAFAATWHVRQDGSGDFTTINGAVAVATAGDVIEVGPGVYPEQVDVLVQLTFVSTDGAATTILDGESSHYTLWFRAGTGHVADGFTFRNGFHISGGGAIRCQAGARLTLRNSILADNSSGHDGGAIFTRDFGSFIDVYDCEFRGNYATHNGAAGIAILDSQINYTRCKFFGQTSGEQNAGVSCDHSRMEVRNCLFVGNVSSSFAGVYYYAATGLVEQSTFYGNHAGAWSTVLIHGSNVDVTRNIIANTTGDEGFEPGGYGMVYLGGTGSHTCNVFYNNERGSSDGPLDPSEIEADPKFCDPPSNNFMISTLSAAAAPYNPCHVLIGAYPIGCGPVAVAISSFAAEARDGSIVLKATFSSTNSANSVNVYRADGEGPFVKIGSGSPSRRTTFEYTDASVVAGKTYRYQVGVVDADGEFMSQIQRVKMDPAVNGLEQNRPNPFNPTTQIRYSLASSERVTLVVFDAAGRVVRKLVDESQGAGVKNVTWDGRDDAGTTVASGVYFYRLRAGKFTDTRRMVMLK